MKSRRWIFWLFLIVGSLAVLSVMGAYFVVQSLRMVPAEVRSGSTLALDLTGELPEHELFDLGGAFVEYQSVTFRDVLDSVQRAKEDSRIDNLLLHFRGTGLGWAQAEEIRGALLDVSNGGKPVVAFLEYGGTLDYYLASAADTIYMHPQSILDLRGLAAQVTFLKSTLDKLGIEAEFEQIGAYKNAPDIFTRESLSEPHRESLQAMVDDLYGRLVDSIATSRGLTTSEVEGILDRGPFRADQARELGLIDQLLYKDEVEDLLAESGDDYQSLSVAAYRARREDGLSLGRRPTIALIYGVGIIVGGQSDEDPLFGRVMGADTVASAFRQVREDSSVDAVVFRIQSPGGSDVASDVIWREAALTREEKPVVVSMADVAASGGYWIATASDAIVAEPSTLTGSIGIYAGKFNVDGLYQKIGFNRDGVLRGESADFWSDARSFTPEERLRLRGILEAGYERFLEKVAESRNMDRDEVDAVGQGRVWTGAQALEVGLVDYLGGLDRAITVAKEKAEIAPDSRVNLEVYPESGTLFDMLWKQMIRANPGITSVHARLPERLLSESVVLKLLIEKPSLALMPYDLKVR